MKYRITKRMRALVADIHALRTSLVERSLDVASSAARDEWGKVLRRLPTISDLTSDFLELSEAELEDMKAKVARFGAILHDGNVPAVTTASGAWRSQRRPS